MAKSDIVRGRLCLAVFREIEKDEPAALLSLYQQSGPLIALMQATGKPLLAAGNTAGNN